MNKIEVTNKMKESPPVKRQVAYEVTPVNVNIDKDKSPIKVARANTLNVPLCHQPFPSDVSACGRTTIDELLSTGKVEGSIMNHRPPIIY